MVTMIGMTTNSNKYKVHQIVMLNNKLSQFNGPSRLNKLIPLRKYMCGGKVAQKDVWRGECVELIRAMKNECWLWNDELVMNYF